MNMYSKVLLGVLAECTALIMGMVYNLYRQGRLVVAYMDVGVATYSIGYREPEWSKEKGIFTYNVNLPNLKPMIELCVPRMLFDNRV